MNKRVRKYLNNKLKSEYTFFDEILSFYSNGQFLDLLHIYGASHIELFPYIGNSESSLQVCFNYHNFAVNLNFKEEYHEYCIYLFGCSELEMESNIIQKRYNNEFNITEFIKNLFEILDSDARLRKNSGNVIKKLSQTKIFNIISIISLCIPALIIVLLSIYTIAFNETVELNWWFSFVIIVPLILWLVFNFKSKNSR